MALACRILVLMDLAYPPGVPSPVPTPLARFLPPVEEGAVTRALQWFGAPGDLVFDPFGASPLLALEAARAGRAVLIAANNPVNQFLLEHSVQPFALAELQTALARMAAAPKDDSRLEPFVLDLYQTECSRCGASVSADYFVWDREADGPDLKGYACQNCNHVAEEAVTQADWERAQSYARRGLQHALALEQVAPAGDADRQHAEAALAVYPGRAVFALITLVNKLEQVDLEPPLRRAAQALLLSAFDAANALWGHPEGRARPLQLSASPRFREANVWRAMEKAVGEWAMALTGVTIEEWPAGGLPTPGAISVYRGPARDLADEAPGLKIASVLSVLPRPNQAYWTLSALWAAWLWGRTAAGPIKVALRRRRYDWAWHASALRTSLAGAWPLLSPEARLLAFMPEAEPGFMAAALAGLDGVGFRLAGEAVRVPDGHAVLLWERAAGGAAAEKPEVLRKRMSAAAASALGRRGEPAHYFLVHAAAWADLAHDRWLAPLWQDPDGNPLLTLADTTEAALGDRDVLIRLGGGTEPEHGLYWLADPSRAEVPLADRVEALVLGALREQNAWLEVELEARLCQALPGLLTPDRRLVQACLRSYAEPDPGTRIWRLRPEDEGAQRAADCEEMKSLLADVGQRVGYTVEGQDPIRWLDAEGEISYAFEVREMAGLGRVLHEPASSRVTFVVPGGRASLVAELARRDPRIRDWLGRRGSVLKYRHVRRLAAETTLNRDNLAERLAIDPPENRDPQMPLL